MFIIGKLAEYTTRNSRKEWAKKIKSCQGDDGWFTKKNYRKHSKEHATAYSVGALKLLEIDSDEFYCKTIDPIIDLLEFIKDERKTSVLMEKMGFKLTINNLSANLGWHYIWKSSHLAGGIAASIFMLKDEIGNWSNSNYDINQWFKQWFDWLDERINPKTGLWQRAFWNKLYKKPTLIDMGGAVHFLWIYSAFNKNFSYKMNLINSVLSIQKDNGLYKKQPFCIDFDANFCLVRSFDQLNLSNQMAISSKIEESLNKNSNKIIKILSTVIFNEIYNDTHGLPGALAALVECKGFKSFNNFEGMENWNNPFNKVCWL